MGVQHRRRTSIGKTTVTHLMTLDLNKNMNTLTTSTSNHKDLQQRSYMHLQPTIEMDLPRTETHIMTGGHRDQEEAEEMMRLRSSTMVCSRSQGRATFRLRLHLLETDLRIRDGLLLIGEDDEIVTLRRQGIMLRMAELG